MSAADKRRSLKRGFRPLLRPILKAGSRGVRRVTDHLPLQLYRLLAKRRDRLRCQREREHRLAFKRFYEELPDKEHVFYIFFSSRLLHWLVKTLEFVPGTTNVVLIGSDLNAEEVQWIEGNIDRPFHHIRLRVDDTSVWEWLFETNQRNFGWLDVDCFVLNPELFGEMADIESDVAINCCWSNRDRDDGTTLCTFLLFINRSVLGEIREKVATISPRAYGGMGSVLHRTLRTYRKM